MIMINTPTLSSWLIRTTEGTQVVLINQELFPCALCDVVQMLKTSILCSHAMMLHVRCSSTVCVEHYYLPPTIIL